MAEKKRKTRDKENRRPKEGEKRKHRRQLDSKTKKEKRGDRRKKTGPRLPNSLRKELDIVKPSENSFSDEDISSDDAANDVYEYEEAIPEEESQKNHRYDPVENFQYQLPEQFEDENVASDDDDDDEDIDVEDDAENHEDEDLRHSRMLQQVTGLPGEVFEGKKKKKDVVISEAYPESEYNPTRDVQDGYGLISINDLLEPLHGKFEFNTLRKRVAQMERKSMSVQAPLPKSDHEKLERKAAYEISKKDITKWEPLVKRNREAPTIYFDEDIDLGFSTVGAIASEFEPRTDFEKKIASLVNNNEVVEAHKNDGARLLELNKVSIDEVKDRQNHLAKMRSLLFRHEMKAKRIKKIKSKTYHRISKKERLKAAASELEMNSEAAKEFARKQAFKRAEERMTLKHKNSSKWAKRILERGLSVQDEGTRAALAEQLHQHALLTRKMNSMKDTSSSDESSDEGEDDEAAAGSNHNIESKLLEKAKEKTLKILQKDDEMPKSGVLSLPFMVRGLQKRKEAADEEAKLALQEYESTLKQLDDNTEAAGSKTSSSSGRRVFGAQRKQVEGARSKIYATSDSEDDSNAKDDVALVEHEGNGILQNEVNVDTELFREESEIGHDPLYKSFEDIIKDPGPKTAYEVAIFASNSWAKKKNIPKQDSEQMNGGETNSNVNNASKVLEPDLQDQDKEVDDDSSTDSEGHMVDGMLSSVSKSTYELPSQAELIQRAFAGDDVEEDFEKDKQEILNEETPEPEKPVLLPGWGQWTHIQKNKGLPSWMLEEHKAAKKKREEALTKRKDAHLKHVVISEKVDKKAEKLHTKTLPYPYTSKEVFEQSIRMPIGPEFNPVTAVGALNRPEVVKKAGVIIKPIKFEDVNPHERGEEQKRSGRKQKKQSFVKRTKKINTKGIKVN